MNRFIRYFLQGLLLVVPISVTIYIIVAAIHWLDTLLPVEYRRPGLGLVVVLTTITVVGYMGSTFIARPIIDLSEKVLNRLPLVRIIYSSLKDLISAFVGDKKKFDRPVLVVINKNSDLKKLGFITQDDLSHLHLKDSIAVYLPHSYNFSGDLYIVPRDSVTRVDAPSAEIMKFIVSGGITGNISAGFEEQLSEHENHQV